jgi:hypothetical protein
MTPQSISALGLTVDLHAEPWRYPGPFLPFSCLQIGDRLLPLRDDPLEALHQHSGTALAELTFVIAVGSNTSPDVVRRKFERQGASTTVLHLVGRLDGYALGYSAHLSRAGFVPATPYPKAGCTTNIVVSALTEHQLDCLDLTEPNYNRVAVPRDHVDLGVAMALPERLHLYESKRGVLVDDAGAPLAFGTQELVAGLLG